jgi:Uma2 family endonuclease
VNLYKEATMTDQVASSLVVEASSSAALQTERAIGKGQNGAYADDSRFQDNERLSRPTRLPTRQAKNRGRANQRPSLPTFPLEVGYREVYDPDTGRYQPQPLTLLDILYPKEEDIGVVVMTQGPLHDRWSRWLADTLQAYLAAEGWLVMHDVLLHWGLPGAPGRSPDVTLIHGGRLPDEGNESYHVGRDGPLPDFVIEITSSSTRLMDLGEKSIAYAAVGIPEYLIIDKGTPPDQPWQLLGYRLGEQPMYEVISPDPEGRLTFAGVELQFEVVGRERVNIYDLASGVRLLTPEEQREFALSEATRANAEATRADAEATRADAEATRADAEATRADAEATRADAEATRADVEATRADSEAAARVAAEARLREMEAILRQAGLSA